MNVKHLIEYYENIIDKIENDIKKLKEYVEERGYDKKLTVDELITFQDILSKDNKKIEIYKNTIKYLKGYEYEYTKEINRSTE